MNSEKNTPRLLGAAFLLQAAASAVGGLILLEPLIDSGSIVETMTRIGNNVVRVRASIVLELITAIGIVMLGALLYRVLHKQDRNIALVALGLYIMEATLLAASRLPAFSLLLISQESLAMGHPANLQTLATLFYELQSFGYELHMLPFALGATLFYILFYKSGYIPRVLALWGVAAASVALIGTPLILFGIDVPLFVFLPNLLFELTIGVWLLVKGILQSSEEAYHLAGA